MEFTLKFKLLVLGIFVFVTTVAFSTAIQLYVVRSRAAGTNIPIRITEKTGSIAGTKDVMVSLTNGEKISAFTLVMKTTGSVKVHDTKEPIVLGSTTGTSLGFFGPLQPKTPEKISYGIQRADAELPTGISVPVTLRCDGVGAGTFTIAASGSQVVGIGQEFALEAIEEGSYTCSSAGAVPTTGPAAGIRAYFNPASAQISVGQQVMTRLVIDGFAKDQQVSGVDVKMKVDAGVDIVDTGSGAIPSKPDPSPVVPSVVAPTASSSTNTGGSFPVPTSGSVINPIAPFEADATGCKPTTTWDSASRMLRIVQLCTGTELLNAISVPIAVKGTSNATGKIAISDLEVVGPHAPNGYSVAKESYSFQVGQGSSTGGQGGNVQLKLKLRLQGIQGKPKQASGLQFKVSVVGALQTTPVTQTASFIPDDAGLYSGSVGMQITPGSGYCILIKGPQQLQKKVCDQNPSELSPGSYKNEKGAISLVAGENSFDFSKIYMMSCDLPVQDGICNSQDLVKIRANLGNTSSQANVITDLNQDTTTNGTDWALALSSLSVKLDD